MKTRIVRLSLALSLMVILVLLVGCGSTPEPSQPPEPTQVSQATLTPAPATATSTPPTPTPVPATRTFDASVALLLAGTYTTTITAQDPSMGFDGDWELKFTADGILCLTRNDEKFEPSPFAVTQEQIEFGHGPGCGSSWSYRWTLESGVLTFAPVGEDPCLNRQTVLTVHPLLRTSDSATCP